ncbi:MAG: DUF6362 family protein [Alphaproteobacteria bacterium]|nr:DUF6362 family protein [Alphaproteobacteria bacterium]
MSSPHKRQIFAENLVKSENNRAQEFPRIILSPLPPPPPHSEWQPEDVAIRLAEAFDVLKRLPLPPHSLPSQIHGSWPQFPSEPNHQDRHRRNRPPAPTPAEITRMEQCLPEWLLLIDDILSRRALYLRLSRRNGTQSPLSTRAVGRILGVSHQTIKNWEDASLCQIAQAINQANHQATKPKS